MRAGEYGNPDYIGKEQPTQPEHKRDMTQSEQDALFDATLERDDVAASVWEAIIDEITPEQAKEIVTVLFRYNGNATNDFYDAGRLLHIACSQRAEKIVEAEEDNTDMSEE